MIQKKSKPTKNFRAVCDNCTVIFPKRVFKSRTKLIKALEKAGWKLDKDLICKDCLNNKAKE